MAVKGQRCEAHNIIPNLMQLLDCLTKCDLNIVFASAELFDGLLLCVTAPRCECMGRYDCAKRGSILTKILPWINKDC